MLPFCLKLRQSGLYRPSFGPVSIGFEIADRFAVRGEGESDSIAGHSHEDIRMINGLTGRAGPIVPAKTILAGKSINTKPYQ